MKLRPIMGGTKRFAIVMHEAGWLHDHVAHQCLLRAIS
jgi:hypothetical protein